MKNIESNIDNLDSSDIKHLYLFLYLIPIFGFFPSLWTLYQHGRDKEVGRLGDGERGSAGAGENRTTCDFRLQTNDFPITPSPHPPITSSPLLRVSRLSVTLAFGWLLGYLLLNVGAETSEFLTLRLLVLNSLLTSGYFLVSIWLMVRLASHSSVRLPGFTSFAERVIGKHLS